MPLLSIENPYRFNRKGSHGCPGPYYPNRGKNASQENTSGILILAFAPIDLQVDLGRDHRGVSIKIRETLVRRKIPDVLSAASVRDMVSDLRG